MTAIAERLVGILPRGCLDHLIVVDERRRRTVLQEFTVSYNADRPAARRGAPCAYTCPGRSSAIRSARST